MVKISLGDGKRATVPEAETPAQGQSTERDLPEPKDHQD